MSNGNKDALATRMMGVKQHQTPNEAWARGEPGARASARCTARTCHAAGDSEANVQRRTVQRVEALAPFVVIGSLTLTSLMRSDIHAIYCGSLRVGVLA